MRKTLIAAAFSFTCLASMSTQAVGSATDATPYTYSCEEGLPLPFQGEGIIEFLAATERIESAKSSNERVRPGQPYPDHRLYEIEANLRELGASMAAAKAVKDNKPVLLQAIKDLTPKFLELKGKLEIIKSPKTALKDVVWLSITAMNTLADDYGTAAALLERE